MKDENTDASITIVVPASLRASLIPNKTIEFIGYTSKRVQPVGARVDLLVNVMEVVSQIDRKYSDEQLRGFELLQKKANIGHKDVDSLIRSKITNSEPITINILIGKAGIVDNDIKHQLQEAIAYYKIYFIRVNLSSVREIIESINFYSKKCDILSIARGGGDGLEVFDKPEIAEAALSLETPFITAIGHQEDVTLLQKVADKAFITPTSLGEYLRTIYNTAIEHLENSKAKLVNDIKKQLEANYEHQIKNLNERALNEKELRDNEMNLLKQQLERERIEKSSVNEEVQMLQSKLAAQTKVPAYVWILIVVAALILGLVIGKLYF